MITAAALDRQAGADAYAQLSAAGRETPLGPEDLERLAAGLTGRDEESAALWARAHQEFPSWGDEARAALCASWVAPGLMNGGEIARAGGSNS